ncbi:hypothetical protein [Oerskovia merdavium]|uniref:Uncharacterized protein n=1 Tax=Oerskovia merdavium TaxID=2762227 RepID=A0ABR8TZX1_9CELL|nr:hypothetical protein [Oerskovia merdavium]MBD7981322.1 hypothetical protein [Oerskovia merdavium]
MLNSREWAILTLLAIFAVVVLSTPSTRKHVLQLLRGASSGVIVIPLVALTVWVAALVTGASHLGLWNSGLAKDTVVWFVVSGFGTIFAALSAAKTDRYFATATKQAVGVAVFIQYAMNLRTFNYLAEVIIQLGLILLAALIAFSERDPRYMSARRLLVTLNVLVGLTLITLTVRELTANLETLDARQTLLGLALSIWLPLGILPFVWLLALYLSYDTLLRRLRMPVFGVPAPLKTRVATVVALGPDLRTAHDLSNRHDDLQVIARTGTWRETWDAVRLYRRQRDRRRAQPALAVQRLRRFAGVRGVDLDGRQLDQRELGETREALQWLALCHMGHHRNRGRYRADLLHVLGDFTQKGLPADHGIQMTVTKGGGSWHAWRRTPSGLVLGIGARSDPSAQWFYAGMQPPGGPPPDGGQWEQGASSAPDWRFR